MGASEGIVGTATTAGLQAFLAALPATLDASHHDVPVALVAHIALCGVRGDTLELDSDRGLSTSPGRVAARCLPLLGGLVWCFWW